MSATVGPLHKLTYAPSLTFLNRGDRGRGYKSARTIRAENTLNLYRRSDTDQHLMQTN